jgi:protein TonB
MPELIGGLESIRPTYPEMERRAGVEGRVFLQFVVNGDGTVSDITVTRGVSPGLDAAAVQAVRTQARFRPGMQRGRPVRVQFSLPINFRLAD